jgi:inorganic phosphate transporter, PiT family
MFSLLLFGATFFLAYSNGANDTFKGVATLFGSKVLSYKQALFWASITAFLGSLCSMYFAESLVETFSGKGIVPLAVASSPFFVLAISIGTGLSVMLASHYGFPVSTTHALIGSLLGAGWMASGGVVNLSVVASKFLGPLLLSPFVAIILGSLIYGAFHFWRKRMGLSKKKVRAPAEGDKRGKKKRFKEYQGDFFGIDNQKLLDGAHIFSGGAVCFARSLNNTPKFVALLIAVQAVDLKFSMLTVALGMLFGGILHSRKIAVLMSKKITRLNHGQGFSANLTTALLVIVASKIGFPVSTTHVSVGSLFGIALVSKKANKKIILEILLSWVLTLPIAALMSALVYKVLV